MVVNKIITTMDEIERIKLEKMKELMSKDRKMEIVIETNEQNFEKDVIEKSKQVAVLVDFYADWCMPCRMLAPILEKIAHDYGGKFILAKVNVDENRNLSQEYRIMSIPNVKLFKNGNVVDEFIGVMPELAIKNWLDRHL